MRTRTVFVAILLVTLAIPLLFAKKKNSDPVMPEVTARGRMLYECDQAAWHSSDAVMATKPSKEFLGRYIPKKSDAGWVVAFGRLNEGRDKFLVAYEATQGTSLQDFTIKKFDPPLRDDSFYLFAARAMDTAMHDFQGEKRSYNLAVLPASSDQLFVYVLPAQTENGVYPLGGDARYLLSADGNKILEKHQMHKTIIENRDDQSKGKTVMGVHTHVLSDVPEDSDVFHVLTQNPPVPELVVTGEKSGYEIREDGTIFPWKR